MKKKFLKHASYVIIIVLGLAMTFTSCEKDPEAMDLPPKESLQIDLDMFPSASGTKAATPMTFDWLYSSITILSWNVVLAVNVAIPVAAYAEAFNHTPVYLGDDSWEWSYTVPVNGVIYSASLIGTRKNNEEFSMEMSLSKEGGFQDFVWFTGLIRYDHTEASWSMNHSPENPVAYLEIVFHKDFDASTADIRYTCVDPANDLFNAYIEYGIDPAFELDAYYTIMKSQQATYIEWNSTTAAGRVMDEVHFGDALWHCWDTQLYDVVCPE